MTPGRKAQEVQLMTIRTNVKAGKLAANHNETLVR